MASDPQQALRRDIAVLHLRGEDRINPRCLWLSDLSAELGLRADDSIELFPDLAGNRARPSGRNLAHVDEVFSLLLAEVERGHA